MRLWPNAGFQHVEAHLADAHGFILAEFNNRHFLIRAFRAQHAAAVSTMVLADHDRETYAAFLAHVGGCPWDLL